MLRETFPYRSKAWASSLLILENHGTAEESGKGDSDSDPWNEVCMSRMLLGTVGTGRESGLSEGKDSEKEMLMGCMEDGSRCSRCSLKLVVVAEESCWAVEEFCEKGNEEDHNNPLQL